MKFIIVSPRQRSGGPIILCLLAKLLNECGHEARVFYFLGENKKQDYKPNVFWRNYIKFFIKDTFLCILVKIPLLRRHMKKYAGYYYKPVRGVKRKFFPFFNKEETIVIYPEIVYGNFLKAEKVVRYLLYYNRFKNDNVAYGKKDLFLCYREIFNDKELNPTCRKMELLNFDSDLYRQTNFGERKGICYIIRKGRERGDLPNYFDGIIVDSLSEEEKVKVFNNCEFCYSYDMQTFYTTVAAICGCTVIQVPESGKTRKDYLKGDDVKYGVAFGDSQDELEYAKNTKCLILERLQEEQKKNIINVKNFIYACEEYFYKKGS